MTRPDEEILRVAQNDREGSHQREAILHDCEASPQDREASPQDREASPQDREASPQDRGATPHGGGVKLVAKASVMLGLVCFLVSSVANAQAPEENAEVPAPVDIVSINAPGIDRELFIVSMFAPSINRETKYMVLLPDNYEVNTEQRYPVLYLLHGFSQNYTVWPMMGAGDHSADYPLIVVMPDGGNSWYVNWAHNEGEQVNNWEDFIAYDLIEHVDRTFRTIPMRFGRAINGLSMGGYGALVIGLRHPELFCSIGSHSGALEHARIAREVMESGVEPSVVTPPPDADTEKDANVPPLIEIAGFTRQSERFPHGIEFDTAESTLGYDPFVLVEKIPVERLPHIYLDCGLNDGLIESTQEFAGLLIGLGIPFTYAQSPGGHNPSYWRREVGQSIAVQYNIMRLALGLPPRNVPLLDTPAAAAPAAAPESAAEAPQP